MLPKSVNIAYKSRVDLLISTVSLVPPSFGIQVHLSL